MGVARRELAGRRTEEHVYEEALTRLELSQREVWSEELLRAEEHHKANCDEAVAAGIETMVRRSLAQEELFAQRLTAAEASRRHADRSAEELAASSDVLRQTYVEEMDRLLAKASKLEEEKILLAEERRQ